MSFRRSLGSSRSALAFAAVVGSVLLAGCSGSSSTPSPAGTSSALGTPATISATATPDSRPRPPGVPASAEQLRAAAEFGDPASTDASGQKFFALDCKDGVITLATTTHVFYAELPCDRSLPEENVQPFLGQPLRVRAVIANPSKLYMDSSTAGTVEFTVGRVWVRKQS